MIERRAKVRDSAEEALAADRDEGGRDPERRNPQIGDRVCCRRSLRPEEIDDRACEHGDRDGKRTAEGERQPQALRTETRSGAILPGACRARDLRRRAVLKEVEHRQHRKNGCRDSECGELRPA